MSFVMEKRPGGWYVRDSALMGTMIRREPGDHAQRETGTPRDQVALGGLQDLTLCVIRLAAMVSRLPGAERPEMDHIAADLMEVAKLVGLQHPDAPNPRPTSAWPEGAAEPGTPEDDER